jgi:hypothetical protein
MTDALVYGLRVHLLLLLFFEVYHVLLRRSTLLHLNRTYLMATGPRGKRPNVQRYLKYLPAC